MKRNLIQAFLVGLLSCLLPAVALAKVPKLEVVNSSLEERVRVSDWGCPSEAYATAFLIDKHVDLFGRKVCEFEVYPHARDPGTPFPLKYIRMECSQNWLSITQDGMYFGSVHYKAVGTSENGHVICNPEFQLEK